MTQEWWRKVIDYYYHNSNVKSLLHSKNIDEIEQYYTGDINMKPFLGMYKSFKRKMAQQQGQGKDFFESNDVSIQADRIAFQPYPLIPSKVNAAVAISQKIPVEVVCTANDALAMKKRKEDIEFLKNKEKLEEDLQPFASELNLGKVDLGETQHSYAKFSSNPLGFDLDDAEQEKMFADLAYALRAEVAIEQALQTFYDVKKINHIRLLETIDQYKWGVSVNAGFRSSTTGLPDAKYIHPGDMYVPYSELPDYSDNVARFYQARMSIMDMFNMFGHDIKSKEQLEQIINGTDKFNPGYAMANKRERIEEKNFHTAKVDLVWCEVKTIDYVDVVTNPKSRIGYSLISLGNDKDVTINFNSERLYGQNTYSAWWLKGTNYFFQIDKLGFAGREKGREAFQTFSTNIYKSCEKSPVEQSIGQNKIAQIASIKLNFAVLLAKAEGVVIDIKGLRGAMDSLKNENTDYTFQTLIDYALERNIMIIDTQDFDGKNDGQLKPMTPIEGGLKNVIQYLNVINYADQKINQFIGTNDSLTGISSNPDALIGVEKLRIDASVNSMYYITQAIQTQYQNLFNLWGNCIQQAVKDGGAVKKAMINYLGIDDYELLKGLDETPLHELTIKVDFQQRVEEELNYQTQIAIMKQREALSAMEEYLLRGIRNPKQRFAKLAAIENKWNREQERIRQEQNEQQQVLVKAKTDGLIAEAQAQTQGKIQQIYAQGEVDAKIKTLASQLGLTEKQVDILGRKMLQQDRAQTQKEKLMDSIERKAQLKNQEPLNFA